MRVAATAHVSQWAGLDLCEMQCDGCGCNLAYDTDGGRPCLSPSCDLSWDDWD